MHQLPQNLRDVVQHWPKPAQFQFNRLREIVLDAAISADIGPLEETLKWNEPAWLPAKRGIGSTLRSSWSPKHPNALGLFLNCNSTLPETMRTLYPNTFTYDGKRSIWLALDTPLEQDALHHCAVLTLTYHRSKT